MAAVATTVLAFDFGLRYIGVAVGETSTGIANALNTIEAESNDARFAAIARLIDEWRPARLVVGKPLAMSGEPHEMTRRAERFARQLAGRFQLPVELVDERLTSIEAEAELRATGRGGRANKHLAHPIAARLILQDYLAAAQPAGALG